MHSISQVRRFSTSSPGLSPHHSKWWSERLLKYSKNRGVFCHVTHDEMAFSDVVSSVRQPCLFFAIWNRCSNKTKTFYPVLCDKILTNFCSHLAALARGFSDRHFEWGEGPGDEVGRFCHRVDDSKQTSVSCEEREKTTATTPTD